MHQPPWQPQQPQPPQAYPPGYGPPVYYPPPRKSRVWLIVLLAVGIPVGLVVLVVALGVGMYALSGEHAASSTEQQMVLRAEDVGPYLEGYAFNAGAEKVVKRTFPDSSYDIEYEYVTDGLVVISTCTVEKDSSDAATSYHGIQIGQGIGMRSEDIEQRPADHLLKWGDKSACYILYMNGNPIGNRFVARKGRVVVDYTFSGVYIEDAEIMAEMLTPVLNRAAAHK